VSGLAPRLRVKPGFVIINSGGFLQGQTDIIETFEQALFSKRIDLE
jgi:hypothetical protein